MEFLKQCLRGIGQVMFQNHAGTGAFFLAGMMAGTPPQVWLSALLALVLSTALTPAGSFKDGGLGGYNAVLVGAALATFLAFPLWLVLLGGLCTPFVMRAVAKAAETFGVSALTAPFVLVTWLLLLASHQFSRFLAHPTAVSPVDWQPGFWPTSILQGVSQVFLVQSPITGVLFLLGLAVSSRPAAVLALLGSTVAAVVSVASGAPTASIEAGLFGFSPVLTAIALGCTFAAPTGRNLVTCLLATVFTVFAQAALNDALQPIALPALTAPFVLVTWLFLIGRPAEASG